MYLNLWNRLLMIFLNSRISRSQHGFMYQRGTMTAWKELLLKIMAKPKSLYEFDLKNCFNQIRISKLISLLKSTGIPQHLLNELRNLNGSSPKLPPIEELDESQAKAKAELQADLDNIRSLGVYTEDQIQNMLASWTSGPEYIGDFSPEVGDDIIWNEVESQYSTQLTKDKMKVDLPLWAKEALCLLYWQRLY